MSWVANMMVQADPLDAANVERLSEWLREDCPWRPQDSGSSQKNRGVGFLRLITTPPAEWGGWKQPECMVWAGTLNHADIPAVLDRISEMAWQYKARVQILLQDQEESYFRLYMFRIGELQQYAPPPPLDADDQHAW